MADRVSTVRWARCTNATQRHFPVAGRHCSALWRRVFRVAIEPENLPVEGERMARHSLFYTGNRAYRLLVRIGRGGVRGAGTIGPRRDV